MVLTSRTGQEGGGIRRAFSKVFSDFLKVGVSIQLFAQLEFTVADAVHGDIKI